MGQRTWLSVVTGVILAFSVQSGLAQPATAPASGPASAAASEPTSAPESQPTTTTSQPSLVLPPAAKVDPVEAFIQKTKKPVPWLSWGMDERLREEYYNNATTLNQNMHPHEYNYQRFRTRIWSTITPIKDIDINTRIVWEFRNYIQPDGPGAVSKTHFDPNEALFDIMNVTWKNFLGLPGSTFVAGRQEITNLGDGWLVFDGTPGDGSRTYFFDAFRATWNLQPIQTTVDTIYVFNRSQEDAYIEPFNFRPKRNQFNAEQDEQGAIVWVTNKSIKTLELDPYFIYKKSTRIPGPYNANNKGQANGIGGEVYTLGMRTVWDIDKHWRAMGDLAPQFGHCSGKEISALGFNSQLSYNFLDKLKNSLRLQYEFLSGDRPGDKNKARAFDILWGRYPRFGDIPTYLWNIEGRTAQYQNMHRIGTGWTVYPVKEFAMTVDYNLLFADEPALKSSNPKSGFSPNGLFRGQLFRWSGYYTFNEHIKTGACFEVFGPGNFYTTLRNDTAVFCRYEWIFTW